MKFSVIIPCYNADPWIQSALRSVAAQTVPAHEIIVVDDGSTDDSVARIEASGVGLRLLHAHRAGTTYSRSAAGAQNAGIQAANGDWIALLDADDVWYPNHLERAAALLDGSADVALMTAHDWITVAGKTVPIPAGFRCGITATTSGLSAHRFLQELVGLLHFGHSTVVYRRERVLEAGAFDVEQLRQEDLDLWLRVIHAHTWCYDTTKTAGYRVDTPGSMSRDVVQCEYYYLRALLKNSAAYQCPEMRALVHTSAQRAMGLAFVNGQAAGLRRTMELCWPYLDATVRTFYRLSAVCPSFFRWGLRWRRILRFGTADGVPKPKSLRAGASL